MHPLVQRDEVQRRVLHRQNVQHLGKLDARTNDADALVAPETHRVQMVHPQCEREQDAPEQDRRPAHGRGAPAHRLRHHLT